MSCENSEVSPLESVAVDEIASPAGTAVGKITWTLALPEESVFTVVVPTNVCPSPKPEGSGVALAKNCSVKLELGTLLSEPEMTVEVPVKLIAWASTG